MTEHVRRKAAAFARCESEKAIQTKILEWLRKQPETKPIKVTVNQFMEAGVADIICCIRGRYVAIEVKRKGGVVSPLQERFLAFVAKAGGIGFVAYSLDDVKAATRSLYEGH